MKIFHQFILNTRTGKILNKAIKKVKLPCRKQRLPSRHESHRYGFLVLFFLKMGCMRFFLDNTMGVFPQSFCSNSFFLQPRIVPLISLLYLISILRSKALELEIGTRVLGSGKFGPTRVFSECHFLVIQVGENEQIYLAKSEHLPHGFLRENYCSHDKGLHIELYQRGIWKLYTYSKDIDINLHIYLFVYLFIYNPPNNFLGQSLDKADHAIQNRTMVIRRYLPSDLISVV